MILSVYDNSAIRQDASARTIFESLLNRCELVHVLAEQLSALSQLSAKIQKILLPAHPDVVVQVQLLVGRVCAIVTTSNRKK